MVDNIISTVLRSVAVYCLALLLARLIGRKLISQMTFFDFIVGISMGSIVANAMIGKEATTLSSVIALITMSMLTIGIAYVHMKSFKARKIMNSEPTTIVHNGIIIEENMKNIRLTINELMMKLREKNAFNLADVEFAIMETDGQLSVLSKADKRPVTPDQMNIKVTSTGLMKDIIIDGVLMEENLKAAEIDKNWVNSQLKTQDIKDISEVFYAGMDNGKILYISKRPNKKKESHGQYGIE